MRALVALYVAAAPAGGALAGYTWFVVRDLFKPNRACYYVAEFEFKMLGIASLLDRGRYPQALSALW